VPAGTPAASAPVTLLADFADHVAAIVLFGKPNGLSLGQIRRPAVGGNPLNAAKLLEMCAPGGAVPSFRNLHAFHRRGESASGVVDGNGSSVA
jgi:cutinase